MCKRVRYWKKVVEDYADALETQQDPYTYVELDFFCNGKKYTASGFSKRCPRDEWDSERGIEIARGRAAKQIAKQLLCEDWVLEEAKILDSLLLSKSSGRKFDPALPPLE